MAKKRKPKKPKLVPPVQSPPGFFVVDDHAARPLPEYRFATAIMEDGKIKLTFAVPTETPVTNRKTKTRMVSQAYTVYIPTTKTVKGKPTVTLRAEQRARHTYEIQRTRKPGGKTITYDYKVFLPYPYERPDGRKVTQARMETRPRTVPASEPEIDYVPSYVTESFTLQQVTCMDTSGKQLSQAQVRKRLKEAKPAVFLNDDSWLTNYFSSLLHPNSILVMNNATKAVRKKGVRKKK